MLRSISASDFDVELVAAVAGSDDNGIANEAAEGFQHLFAQLLQRGDVLCGNTVVNVILFCSGRTFELAEIEMRGKLKIFHKNIKFFVTRNIWFEKFERFEKFEEWGLRPSE